MNGFVLLVVSMLIGSYILAFFGISLPVVQVAGGLVLTATGWSLLSRPPGEASADRAVETTHRDWLQQSFYPLDAAADRRARFAVGGCHARRECVGR